MFTSSLNHTRHPEFQVHTSQTWISGKTQWCNPQNLKQVTLNPTWVPQHPWGQGGTMVYQSLFRSHSCLKSWDQEVGQKDGRIVGSWAHLIPWTHWDVSYIYATNSENDLKTSKTDLPQLIAKRRPHWEGWEGWRHGQEPNPQWD